LVAAAFDGTAAPSFGEGLAMEEGGMVSGELVEQSLQFNGHTQRSEAALERAKKMLQTPWSPPWPFVRREEAAAGAVVKSISAARNSQNAVPPYDEDDVPEPRADYEEWDGPNGIRPEAPPYRMKTPADHMIRVMPDYIAGFLPEVSSRILRIFGRDFRNSISIFVQACASCISCHANGEILVQKALVRRKPALSFVFQL